MPTNHRQLYITCDECEGLGCFDDIDCPDCHATGEKPGAAEGWDHWGKVFDAAMAACAGNLEDKLQAGFDAVWSLRDNLRMDLAEMIYEDRQAELAVEVVA